MCIEAPHHADGYACWPIPLRIKSERDSRTGKLHEWGLPSTGIADGEMVLSVVGEHVVLRGL